MDRKKDVIEDVLINEGRVTTLGRDVGELLDLRRDIKVSMAAQIPAYIDVQRCKYHDERVPRSPRGPGCYQGGDRTHRRQWWCRCS